MHAQAFLASKSQFAGAGVMGARIHGEAGMALKLGGFVIMLMMSFINIIQEATKAPASHEDTTLIGQLVLLATFLVNIIVQLWRESRARKWQLADEANRKT